MNKIKFRFWDKEIDTYEGQEPVMRYWPSSPQEISLDAWIKSDAPCMQFTGLLDRTGKEIYESDILQPTDGRNTCVVKFIDGCFIRHWTSNNSSIPLKSGIELFEVIGNIYENPELLPKS
jgi:uncharacterized phage protein (TIGR01671 family)